MQMARREFNNEQYVLFLMQFHSLFPRASAGGVQRPRDDFGQDEVELIPPQPALGTDTGTQGQKDEQETNPAKGC